MTDTHTARTLARIASGSRSALDLDGLELATALLNDAPRPEGLTTLAQRLAFHRTDAERRARAEIHDAELLAETLRRASLEVGYSYAQSAGRDVALAAMIDTEQTDYFGHPLPRAVLARRKRAATLGAQRLVRELLAEPLDELDMIRFGEGMDLEAEDRQAGYSDISPAVYAEVRRIADGWSEAA